MHLCHGTLTSNLLVVWGLFLLNYRKVLSQVLFHSFCVLLKWFHLQVIKFLWQNGLSRRGIDWFVTCINNRRYRGRAGSMLTVSEVSEDVSGVLFLFPLIFSSSELVPVWDWLSPHISEMASTLLPHRSKSSRLGGAQLQKSLYRSWESLWSPHLGWKSASEVYSQSRRR